jgi:WD40 repeat protein
VTGTPLAVAADSGVNDVAFSPDGAFVAVAAGSIGREVSFWNVGSRAKLASYTPAYIASSIAYAPDGRTVAGGELYCGKIFVCSPK